MRDHRACDLRYWNPGCYRGCGRCRLGMTMPLIGACSPPQIMAPCHSTLSADQARQLTHWGRVTHICVGNLTIIGSDNGLSPHRHQAIIWTNAGILLIGPLGTNFSEILLEINTFSLKKMHLKASSAKWRPFCLSLNVLTLSPSQGHSNSRMGSAETDLLYLAWYLRSNYHCAKMIITIVHKSMCGMLWYIITYTCPIGHE